MKKFLIAAALPAAMLGTSATAQTSAGTGTTSGTGTMTPSTATPSTQTPTTPTTGPHGATSTAGPAAPGAHGGTMPGGAMSDGTMGSSSTTPSTSASANSSAAIDAAISDGFPRYDKDSNGTLSETEFKAWVSDLKAQEMAATGKPKDNAAVQTYAGSAWASADANTDKSVSRDELRAFLGG